MKVHHITAAIVLASAAALAGPASAVTTTGNLMQDINSSVRGEGNIFVTISGDTATLTGYASGLDKLAAERVAQSYPQIDHVINHISDLS